MTKTPVVASKCIKELPNSKDSKINGNKKNPLKDTKILKQEHIHCNIELSLVLYATNNSTDLQNDVVKSL